MNKTIYKEVRQEFLNYLTRNKLRKTPERFVILETICSQEGHFDIESLCKNIKEKGFKVSRATVYNTLGLLLSCNMVVRHQFGDATTQYEKAFSYRQHDHLICNQCHKIMEFCDPRIQNIQNSVEQQFSMRVQHHSLILYVDCNRKNCESRP